MIKVSCLVLYTMSAWVRKVLLLEYLYAVLVDFPGLQLTIHFMDYNWALFRAKRLFTMISFQFMFSVFRFF